MKPSPGGHSLNNMKSVSVIIARESEGRAVQRKRECCAAALSPVFFGGGFPLTPQLKLRMRIEIGPNNRDR